MAVPELCDGCGQFPPNVLLTDLSDGATRYLCWPCVGGLAEAVIASVTGGPGPGEPEVEPAEPGAPDATGGDGPAVDVASLKSGATRAGSGSRRARGGTESPAPAPLDG